EAAGMVEEGLLVGGGDCDHEAVDIGHGTLLYWTGGGRMPSPRKCGRMGRATGSTKRGSRFRHPARAAPSCGLPVGPRQAGSSGVRLIPEGPPTLASPRLETP